MSIFRLQTSLQLDTALPRDTMVITPHFEIDIPVVPDSPDIDALCEDLADFMFTWVVPAGEIKVTGYDAAGAAPNPPLGSAVRRPATVGASVCPREVALCLSFFNETNSPRHRGRLYVPTTWFTGAFSGPRPNSGNRDKVMELGAALTDLGGADVMWCVYSRADGVARKVTDYYCDDEWDTMRSRGMRSTTRTNATTSQ